MDQSTRETIYLVAAIVGIFAAILAIIDYFLQLKIWKKLIGLFKRKKGKNQITPAPSTLSATNITNKFNQNADHHTLSKQAKHIIELFAKSKSPLMLYSKNMHPPKVLLSGSSFEIDITEPALLSDDLDTLQNLNFITFDGDNKQGLPTYTITRKGADCLDNNQSIENSLEAKDKKTEIYQNYTSDKFNGVLYRWKFRLRGTGENREYKIEDIEAHCPDCDCKVIEGEYSNRYSIPIEIAPYCPLCKQSFEPQSDPIIESLIWREVRQRITVDLSDEKKESENLFKALEKEMEYNRTFLASYINTFAAAAEDTCLDFNRPMPKMDMDLQLDAFWTLNRLKLLETKFDQTKISDFQGKLIYMKDRISVFMEDISYAHKIGGYTKESPLFDRLYNQYKKETTDSIWAFIESITLFLPQFSKEKTSNYSNKK